MNAYQEINGIVKKARDLKPINYFSKYDNGAADPMPFNFKGEALKLLKPFRHRVGQHGADQLARELHQQFKDMQANPGKYDEAKQRQILSRWKSKIDQFDRRAKQTAHTRNLVNNRQAVVAPQRASTSGWDGKQVVQGGSAPVSRVPTSSINPTLNAVKTENGQNFYSDGRGGMVAQNDLPSMKMQAKWNTPYPNTPEGRRQYIASYFHRAPSKAPARPQATQTKSQLAGARPSATPQNAPAFGA